LILLRLEGKKHPPVMLPDTLTIRLKEEAHRLGFDLVGATAAVEPEGFEHLRGWLDRGFAGEMRYLGDRLDAYRHPRHVLEGARSLLMLGIAYRTDEPAAAGPGTGRVSRYAWGQDYHDVIREKLHALADFHRELTPDASVRGIVDTAPLLEREFARRAGLGSIGKNTLLITPQFGSWVFLAALLTSEKLAYDAPEAVSRCGSCRACLDACPTGALCGPYQLDARRCVSYLTIELRGSVDEELRGPMGNRMFGCDACQEACPLNRQACQTKEEAFRPREESNPMDAIELLSLDEEAFRRRFRGTPLWRAKRQGLLRDAAIALGNTASDSPEARAALEAGVGDADPVVREACVWALSRYQDSQ
jgi:epoxyqueuosine reductase